MRRLYLDVDLVAEHGRSEDHGFGSSLELFAHVDGLLKGGAPLVHIPGIQDLWDRTSQRCFIWRTTNWATCTVCHLAVGVDACVDEPLQYELSELVLQSGHCGVEGLRHLSHVS